jgi:ABC-type dipeptide/oligopeptide/nickel transport system ATPase component
MGQNNYPKGSEWRKWDLHIHTPCTKLNNGYGSDDVWNKFCDEIEKSDVSVFGITDYFSVDNYFLFIEKFKKRYPKSEKVFFPNIEFRIDSKNKNGEHIQLHVIFSNSIEKDKLELFLARLKLVSTDDINLTNKYCTNSDLSEVGYENAMVTLGALTEQLKENFSEEEYVIIGVANGYGSLRPGENDGRGAEYAKEIDKNCHMFFGNESNVEFFLNKESGREKYNLPPKPVLKGSDCHSFEDISSRLGKFFTWIKADPNFEGLKQIIYEPEERVRIQENNPQNEYPKHYFSKVIIKETNIFNNSEVKFKQNEIELNHNLVTIIGGRGTGKSLLLDAIAKTFKKIDGNERAASISIKKDDFSVIYTKSDNTNKKYNIQEENIVDYLHIHQGYVKAIVDPKNSGKLDKEIKELLNLNEKPKIPYDKSFLSRLIDEIFEIRDFFNEIDENGEKINSKEFIEKQQKHKKKLIENITTKKNEERISKYTNNIKAVNDLDKKMQQLEDLKRDLEQFQSYKNNLIKGFNQLIDNENIDNKNKIPEISFDEQIQKIDSLSGYYEKKKKNIEEENQKIEEDFKNEGFSGDITTLLEQAKKYQEEIDVLENKKKLVEDKEKNLKRNFDKIKEVIDKISDSYKKFEEDIKNKWSNLKKGKEGWDEEQKELVNKLLKDIDIEVIESFDKDKFYEKIKVTLNLSKFRATINESQDERINKFFNINTKEDFVLFLKNEKKINEGEMSLSELINSEYFVKDGAKEFLRLILLNYSDFWQVITKPKYKNKELNQLSVGMKGTMYLCLKLATDPFMKPFIFDQPEDDLDNNFIVSELVPIFKTIKKYRQVIIVTHNANLVVNTDAEQVIVAENENETINYISGSLENVNIRNKVCEILEGGIDAFRKREKKYNIK